MMHVFLLFLFFFFSSCGHSSSSPQENKKSPVTPTLPTVSPTSPAAPSDTLPSLTRAANADSALAINVDSADYWSPQWTYVNIMHASSNWLPQCSPWRTDGNSQACTALDQDPNPANNWDTQESLDLDANGWVRSLPQRNDVTQVYRFATVVMFLGARGHYPAGKYIILYDGEGVLEYAADASKDIAASTPGRDVLNVTPTNAGIRLTITSTDPQRNGNYIRNIRVIVPGGICNGDPFTYHPDARSCAPPQVYQSFEEIYAQQLFHPLFLNNLRRFKVLRFMTFATINHSTIANWSDRALLTHHSWNRWHKGPPPEIFIELANRIEAHPWVNIPHMAIDDYIRQFALLTKQLLKASQHVYVEYSNEVWNFGYPFSIAGNYVEQQGLNRWPQAANAYEARLNAYAKRTVEICTIWKQVFAGEENRVVCVMASQAGSRGVSQQELDCPLYSAENGGIPCGQKVDALAIAPYFGFLVDDPKVATVRSWMRDADGGMNKAFEELHAGNLFNPSQRAVPAGAIPHALQIAFGYMDLHIPIATHYGLDLITYEGGQHLVALGNALSSSHTDIHDFLAKMNRDPRMGALYTRYLEGWKERGGKFFALFSNITTPGPHGSWGAREFEEDTEAVKWKAIQQFMTDNPRWWQE